MHGVQIVSTMDDVVKIRFKQDSTELNQVLNSKGIMMCDNLLKR